MHKQALLMVAMILGAAAPSLAGELPSYDRKIEQAVIARLQARLPELRSAYDITQHAKIPALDAAGTTNWMSKLIQPSIMKYRGRILWL